jgi:flagellar biogenesis protein FliO
MTFRIGRKRKELAVRETAALGDRRFVSVIQFGRQRFLIGCSPSSVSLLAQLPDESSSAEDAGGQP